MAEKREIRYRTTMDARDFQRGSRKVEEASSGMRNVVVGAQRRMGEAALNMGTDLARLAAQWVASAPLMAEKAAIVAESAEKVLGTAAQSLRDDFAELRLVMGLNIGEFDSLIARMGLVTEVMSGGDEAQGAFIGRIIESSAALAAFQGDISLAGEVTEALMALMRGEVDTIERWGVNLKKADIDERALELQAMNSELDEQSAFYLALVELVEEQAAPAFDSLATAQDTAAAKGEALRTKSEDLQIMLGDKLLPIFVALLDFVLRGIEGWEQLSKAIGERGVMGTLRILVPGLDAVAKAIERVVGWLRTLSRWAGSATSALGRIKVPKIRLPSLSFPGFAGGGMVPGPVGAPQLAVVHGGERISGIGGRSGGGGGGGVTVNVSAGISSPQETAEVIIDLITLWEQQNGALPFGAS